MMGMSDHYHLTQLNRHQAEIDADDEQSAAHEERAEAAAKAFNDACKSHEMKTPMPFTEMGVFSGYQKIGIRQETLEEVIYNALESEILGQQVFKALTICAANGSREAIHAIELLRDKYVEQCVQQLMG